MNIVFWDIDGTLIRTSRAGLLAFEEAVAEKWHKKIDFTQIQTAGRTDYFIAQQIIEQICQSSPAHEEIMALTGRYEELLLKHLEERPGWVLPSVKDILIELKNREDCLSLLLTGNSRTGAEIKLGHFGIAELFDFDHSAFCDAQGDRDVIAAQGLCKARKLHCGAEPLKIFVIGDTPHDISCGKAINAYTIGVGTGNYPQEELSMYNPWWSVEQLPEAQEFLARIDGVEAAAVPKGE